MTKIPILFPVVPNAHHFNFVSMYLLPLTCTGSVIIKMLIKTYVLISAARLHLLGLDVQEGKDPSLDASEQLMGSIQIAKGGELLTPKFTNILHVLQVVQLCHWKSSDLKV
ncbi:unnamed protein product [Brassica oleracea]